MFDELYEKNELKQQFLNHLKLQCENTEEKSKALSKELTFIKELISGGKTGKVGYRFQLFSRNTGLVKLYKDYRPEL